MMTAPAPICDAPDCADCATTERTVEETVVHLCADCAAEVDADAAHLTAARAGLPLVCVAHGLSCVGLADGCVTPEQIDALARTCAAELRGQGWTGPAADYDLGVYHGDAEALDALMGRAASVEERVSFERAVREAL